MGVGVSCCWGSGCGGCSRSAGGGESDAESDVGSEGSEDGFEAGLGCQYFAAFAGAARVSLVGRRCRVVSGVWGEGEGWMGRVELGIVGYTASEMFCLVVVVMGWIRRRVVGGSKVELVVEGRSLVGETRRVAWETTLV